MEALSGYQRADIHARRTVKRQTIARMYGLVVAFEAEEVERGRSAVAKIGAPAALAVSAATEGLRKVLADRPLPMPAKLRMTMGDLGLLLAAHQVAGTADKHLDADGVYDFTPRPEPTS